MSRVEIASGQRIDRDSPVPYYAQIATMLQEQIESDELHPGARLPSEGALAARFEVSRMTARKAVLQLTAKGLVTRRERSGTFVAQPRLAHAISTESSFSASMIAAGHTVETTVLSAGLEPATETTASVLGVPAGDPVIDIRRVRIVDGDRVAIHETRVATRFAAVLGHDLTGSLTEALQKVGAGSDRATDTVDVINADARLGRILQIPVGSPLVRVEGVGFGPDDQAVRHTLSLFRGDRFRFNINAGPGPFDIQLVKG